MADTSYFDVEVFLDTFERDLFARVAFGEVNLAEAADADAAADHVAIEGALAVPVLEFHRSALAFHDRLYWKRAGRAKKFCGEHHFGLLGQGVEWHGRT